MLRKGIDLEVPTNCPECPEYLLSKVELGFWVTLRLTLHIPMMYYALQVNRWKSNFHKRC